VVIGKGYMDEYRFDSSQLEACMFVINQEQVFEVVCQMKINCVWSKAKLNVDWVSDEEINQDDYGEVLSNHWCFVKVK
jgi:hypothetical protein